MVCDEVRYAADRHVEATGLIYLLVLFVSENHRFFAGVEKLRTSLKIIGHMEGQRSLWRS